MKNTSFKILIATLTLLPSLVISQPKPEVDDKLFKLEQKADNCYTSLTSGHASNSEIFCSQLFAEIPKFKAPSFQRLHAITVYAAYMASTKNSESSTKSLQKAIKEFKLKDIESQAELANSHQVLGTIYLNDKKFSLASKSTTDALKISEKIGNASGVIENLLLMSEISKSSGDKSRSEIYALKAIELIEKIHPSRIEKKDQLMYLSYLALAQSNEYSGFYDRSLSNAIISAKYADKAFGDSINPFITSINSYVARLYLVDNAYDKALPFALKALRSLDEPSAKITSDNVSAMISLFSIYTSTENDKKARDFADKYVNAFMDMPESTFKVKALGSLGTYYMRSTDNKTMARKLILSATKIAFKLFGPESSTANELAGLAESPELIGN